MRNWNPKTLYRSLFMTLIIFESFDFGFLAFIIILVSFPRLTATPTHHSVFFKTVSLSSKFLISQITDFSSVGLIISPSHSSRIWFARSQNSLPLIYITSSYLRIARGSFLSFKLVSPSKLAVSTNKTPSTFEHLSNNISQGNFPSLVTQMRSPIQTSFHFEMTNYWESWS